VLRSAARDPFIQESQPRWRSQERCPPAPCAHRAQASKDARPMRLRTSRRRSRPPCSRTKNSRPRRMAKRAPTTTRPGLEPSGSLGIARIWPIRCARLPPRAQSVSGRLCLSGLRYGGWVRRGAVMATHASEGVRCNGRNRRGCRFTPRWRTSAVGAWHLSGRSQAARVSTRACGKQWMSTRAGGSHRRCRWRCGRPANRRRALT